MTTPLPPGGPWDAPTTLELPGDAGPVAALAFTDVGFADLGRCFDDGFSRLAALGPTGPGYAVYTGEVGPGTTFDLTIGFPVAEGTVLPEDADGIRLTVLPAGPALALTHHGGFEGLGGSWARLADVAGAAPVRGMLEVYTTDPSVTAEPDLRTDLFLLI